MKILFNANRFPYPPFRGDKLKIYHLAKRLAKQHEVHLLTFLQDKDDLQHLPKLEKIFTEIHLVPLPKWRSIANSALGVVQEVPVQIAFFKSAAMRQKIDELLEQHCYDAVHVQHLRMAQFWNQRKSVPRILDLPDAYSLYWHRGIEIKSGPAKLFAQMEYKRLLRYEKIINDFNLALVCSTEDQQYLKEQIGINRVELLPNGVDLGIFSSTEHDYTQDQTLLFTGNMDYAPNVDAVQYFAKDVFPKIKAACPNTKFVIAGQNPVKKVKELANEAIEVTGFVKELATMYRRAAVVVAPLRFGAGTQNKVLEAMAMGVPVVSHHIGFNGLNIASGQGVFQEDTADDFALRCIDLLQSVNLRRKTGQSGREVIQSRFDWNQVSKQLEAYLYDVSQAPSPKPAFS